MLEDYSAALRLNGPDDDGSTSAVADDATQFSDYDASLSLNRPDNDAFSPARFADYYAPPRLSHPDDYANGGSAPASFNGVPLPDDGYDYAPPQQGDDDEEPGARATQVTAAAATLTVSNVRYTSADLTISGHVGTWYYQADKAPHTNCSGTSLTSYRVTNLTDDTEYTYTAYSDSACTTKLDDVTFTTLEKKLVLSDWGRFEPIGQNTASLDGIGFDLNLAHLKGDDSGAPHSTCTKWIDVGDRASGVIALTGLDPNTEYTYRGYEDSGCATEVASITFTTLPAVLTATNLGLTTASLRLTGNRGRAFYYQANTGPHTACTLQGAGGVYQSVALSGLTKDTEYTYTAYTDSACTSGNELDADGVTFTTLSVAPTLTVSYVSPTTALLTMSEGWTGAWQFSADAFESGYCYYGGVYEDGKIAYLTGLTPGATYTFKAYAFIPGLVNFCTAEIGADVTFTTPAQLTKCDGLSVAAAVTRNESISAWSRYVEVKNNTDQAIHDVRALTYYTIGNIGQIRTDQDAMYDRQHNAGKMPELQPGTTGQVEYTAQSFFDPDLAEVNGVVQRVNPATAAVLCETAIEPSWWRDEPESVVKKGPANPEYWISTQLDNPLPGAGENATVNVTAYATTRDQLLQACVNIHFDGLEPVDADQDGNHDVVIYDGPNGKYKEDGTLNVDSSNPPVALGYRRAGRLEYDSDGYDEDAASPRHRPQCSDADGKFEGSLFRIGNTDRRTDSPVKWPTTTGAQFLPLTYTIKVPVAATGSGSGCLTATVRALPPETTDALVTAYEKAQDNTAKACLGPPPSGDPELPVLFQSGRADLITMHKCVDGTSFPCAGKSADDLVQYVRTVDDDFESGPGPVDSENLAYVGSGNAAENAGSPYRAFRPGDVVTHVPDFGADGGRRVRVNAEPNNVPSGTYPANRPAWYTAHDLADRPSDSNDFGHLATLGSYLKGVAVKYRFLGSNYSRYALSMCAKHDPDYLTSLTETTPCDSTAKDTNPGLMRGLWWKSWTVELLDMAETPQPTINYSSSRLYPLNMVFEFSTLGTHEADIIYATDYVNSPTVAPTADSVTTVSRHKFHVGPAADLRVYDGGASASVASGKRTFTIIAESEPTAEINAEITIGSGIHTHEEQVNLHTLIPEVTVTAAGGAAIPAANVSQVGASAGSYDTATGVWTLPEGFQGQATLTLVADASAVGSVTAAITNSAEVCENAAGVHQDVDNPGASDAKTSEGREACEWYLDANGDREQHSNADKATGYHWGAYQRCIKTDATAVGLDPDSPSHISGETACTTNAATNTWHTTEVYDWRPHNNEVTFTPSASGFSLGARPGDRRSIELSWSRQRDADSYAIYSVSAASLSSPPNLGALLSVNQLEVVSGDVTKYSHDDLDIGETRYYLVRARKDGRPYAMSGVAGATAQTPTSYIRVPDLVIPLGPGSVRATAVWPQGARLSWSGPSTLYGAAVEYYEIFASDDGLDWATLVRKTTETSYVDETLAAGKARYYRIYAHNREGHSLRSEVARGTGAGLIARAEGMGRIRLIWIGAGAEESYDVERSEDGVTWEEIATGVSGTGYTDASLTPGDTRFYRVYPYRSGVRGSVSAVVSATTINDIGGASDLSVDVSEAGAVTLTWTPGAGANAHIIAGLRDSAGGPDDGRGAVYGYADELDKHTVPAEDMAGGVWTFYVLALYRSDDGTEDLTDDTPIPSIAVVKGYPGPTAMTATPGAAPDRIALEWEPPPADFYGLPTEYYEVESSTDGSTWTQLTTDLPVPEYTDTGLALGDTRHYRVFAHNAEGRTLPSASAYATTIQLGPASEVEAVLNGDGTATATWTAGPDANLYVLTVERQTEDGSYDSATPVYVTVTSQLTHTIAATHISALPSATYAITVRAGHETRYGTRVWTAADAAPYAELVIR